jgi:hypothetical protein
MLSVAERYSPSPSAQVGWDRLNQCRIGGFPHPVFSILIPISVSTPFILRRSRMRKPHVRICAAGSPCCSNESG